MKVQHGNFQHTGKKKKKKKAGKSMDTVRATSHFGENQVSYKGGCFYWNLEQQQKWQQLMAGSV